MISVNRIQVLPVVIHADSPLMPLEMVLLHFLQMSDWRPICCWYHITQHAILKMKYTQYDKPEI